MEVDGSAAPWIFMNGRVWAGRCCQVAALMHQLAAPAGVAGGEGLPCRPCKGGCSMAP